MKYKIGDIIRTKTEKQLRSDGTFSKIQYSKHNLLEKAGEEFKVVEVYDGWYMCCYQSDTRVRVSMVDIIIDGLVNFDKGLKPCPFCDNKANHGAKENRYGTKYRVICLNCRIQTGWYPTQGLANKAWNKRK